MIIGIAADSSGTARAVDMKCIGVVVELGEELMWYVVHYLVCISSTCTAASTTHIVGELMIK